MRIKQKKKNPWILPLLIFVCLLASILAYAYYKKLWFFAPQNTPVQPTQSINYNPPSTDEKTAGEQVKTENNTPVKQDTNSSSNTDTTTSSTVPMAISATTVDSGILRIRILIQTVSSSGTCSLTMTGPGNKTYSTSAGVQAGPSSSTCQGFDIPTSSLASGAWKATVAFKDGTLTGSTTGEVVIP